MKINSVHDEAFRPYGRVWDDIPASLTRAVVAALESDTPLPRTTDYVACEPALDELPAAEPLKRLFFGGGPAELGWCCGHNTKLNALEYHRASEFNLGSRDFVLLLAGRDQIVDGMLDTALVRAFRVPAGVAVEVFATTLHYAPCQVDEGGFRVMVALPRGTNAALPPRAGDLRAGDAELLWAQDKWLIAHADSDEAKQGAAVRLIGSNIDIADRLI